MIYPRSPLLVLLIFPMIFFSSSFPRPHRSFTPREPSIPSNQGPGEEGRKDSDQLSFHRAPAIPPLPTAVFSLPLTPSFPHPLLLSPPHPANLPLCVSLSCYHFFLSLYPSHQLLFFDRASFRSTLPFLLTVLPTPTQRLDFREVGILPLSLPPSPSSPPPFVLSDVIYEDEAR